MNLANRLLEAVWDAKEWVMDSLTEILFCVLLVAIPASVVLMAVAGEQVR